VRLDAARSLLFAPGNDDRKLQHALESDADCIVADLEDSVPPQEKERARESIRRAFGQLGRDGLRSIRVNDRESVDLAFISGLESELDAIVIPKATPASCLAASGSGLPLIAIIETAVGVVRAVETASMPNVVALCLGNLDLSAEMGLTRREDGADLAFARGQLVVASAAAGLRGPFDGVYVDFKDPDGLRREIAHSRSLGFRGKVCIHPSQVADVNDGFSPSASELVWAREVIDADDRARREGSGVTVVGGAMIDEPVVVRARRLLAARRDLL
jgi:citrate lyase subunit beta / citryl-CoA lyase